tara:strand:- start:545 stop:724 length:180 start_codon:yes stop_codon:yes gene_type:complete
MPLIEQQRIVYLTVNSEEYSRMDFKIRQALEIFPDCKILSLEMQHLLWGANVFVLIEVA